ncbi:MAG: hypothetical protein KBF92_09320, partial [Bacteroidia bacterium]|nr:hypothetical protein [Bacteroidia bacterium]
PFISTVFSESMGTVPGTTQIATHESGNGFDNDGLTMSGTGDVRTSLASSGYSGASGGANVFITNTAGKNFIVSGINTVGLVGLELSFGIFKSTIASNGSELLVQYSTDGINYFSLPFAALPTGSGTSNWVLRSVTGLPSSATLSIQFIQTGTLPQFRIDDVILTGEKAVPEITILGNTNLCQGSSVELTADPGSFYFWDDGQTTQSISVSNSSIHSCLVTSVNGCSALSALVNITSNPELFTLSGGGNYCTGETAPSIILSGSQATVNYQLKHNLNNVGPIVSGTGSPIDFGTQSTAGTYTVIATDISTSCTATMLVSVIVNENSLPGDFSITGNSSFCSGSSGTLLGLSGSETGVSYQLKLNGSNSGVEIAGTGSAISFGNKNIVGLYTVVATNTSTLCTASMTGSLSLIQNTSPSSFALAGGGGYCQGGSGVNITLANSQSGVNYSLYNSSGNTGINFNGTGAAISFGNSTMPDDYYIIGTDLSNGCQSAMTDTITVSLLPLPIIYSVTGGGSFCSVPDLGVAVGLNNSEMGVTYQLLHDLIPLGSPQNGSGFAFDFGNQIIAGNYTVVATKQSSGCTLTMNSNVDVIRNLVSTWYIDADNDGYGNPAIFILDCDQPSGYISDNTDCNDGNEFANPGEIEICGNSIDDNCDGDIDEGCSISINLKVFIQGYYLGSLMQNSPLNSLSLSDTVIVKLAISVSPYTVLYSDTTFITVSGDIEALFPPAILNSEFYIIVEHRNSIQTWSSNSILIDQNNIIYDFTNSIGKAFGNNLADNGDGTFSLLSGDVNKDGVINDIDYLLLENGLLNLTENYTVLDLTGDNLIESSDFSLIENNIQNNISIQKP